MKSAVPAPKVTGAEVFCLVSPKSTTYTDKKLPPSGLGILGTTVEQVLLQVVLQCIGAALSVAYHAENMQLQIMCTHCSCNQAV